MVRKEGTRSGPYPRKGQAELAFVIVRLLMIDRLFWGCHGGLGLATLGRVIGAPPRQVARAVSSLRDEGLVRVDRARRRVGLTDLAVRELAAGLGGSARR
jgi:DNA-binding IclR family transcriptional regulator